MSVRPRLVVLGFIVATVIGGAVIHGYVRPAMERELAVAEHALVRAAQVLAQAKQDRDAAVSRLGDRAGANPAAVATTDINKPDSAPPSSAPQWLRRVKQLKHAVMDDPAQSVPELTLLDDRDWLLLTIDVDLDREIALRRACANARNMATDRFLQMMQLGLKDYLAKHNGQLPADTLDLLSEFPLTSNDFASMLSRYKVLRPGTLTAGHDTVLIRQDEVIDSVYDERSSITRQPDGQLGMMTSGGRDEDDSDTNDAEVEAAANGALAAFRKANNGLLPQHPAQLLPYLKKDTVPPEYIERLNRPFTPDELTEFQDRMKKWAAEHR